MLAEIFELLGSLVMLITPAALCCLVLLFVVRLSKGEKESAGQAFKSIFCIAITVGIIFSIMMVTIFNVYQVGMIWKEVEAETYVEQYVKEASFVAVEFIWQMIGVALMFLLWKYVYIHQIIPGEGTAKIRFKQYIKSLKKKNIEEK